MYSILYVYLWMTCFMYTSAISKDNTKTDLKSGTEASCAIVVNEGDIIELRRLLEVEHVNMADLELFSEPNFDKRLFSHWQITFVTTNGRTLLSLLDIKYFIITWPLTAGRRRFSLRFLESRSGCLQTMKNKTDFVSGNLLKQIIGGTQRTYCEVCYVEVNQLHSTRRCCNMSKKHSDRRYQCYNDQHQNELLNLIFHTIPTCITGVAFIFIFTTILCSYRQVKMHKMDSKYYYLTENTMSISCLFRFITVDEHGRTISIIRKLLFVFVIGILYTSHLKGISTYLDYSIVYYWAIFFPFSNVFKNVTLRSDDKRRVQLEEKLLSFLSNIMASHLKYDLADLSWGSGTESDSWQQLISLPFNIKHWKIAIKRVHKVMRHKTSILRWETKNSIYNSFQENAFCLFFIALILVYIPVILFMMILFMITTTCFYVYKVAIHSSFITQTSRSCCDLLFHIHELLILIHTIIITALILQFTWIPFYTGLLGNMLYFIPHITVVSVSIFYFLQIWTSLGNKYFALKMFIYEECKDRMYQNNPDSDKDSQSKSGDIVPVVSKQLYCKIREKLLPYHTVLWIHGFKLLSCILSLLFFIYVIVEQQKYNATPVVKVLTTLSVSVLPYIFNSITLKLSDEEKRALDERLRLNVKRMVDKLIAEDPEHSKIVLTIPLGNREKTVHGPDISDESAEDDEPVSTEPNDNIQFVTAM